MLTTKQILPAFKNVLSFTDWAQEDAIELLWKFRNDDLVFNTDSQEYLNY